MTVESPTRKLQRNRPDGVGDGAKRRASSASDLIYHALWDDIVSLRRRPGEPIVEKELCAHYGVSRTPVREAILRLAGENLIEIMPQSGTFVARIPLDALSEAVLIRSVLEEVTVRGAAERITRAQAVALRANLDLQRAAAADMDQDAFRKADDAFHAAIAEAAGYPRIWTIVKSVKIQVDRYCHMTLPRPGRMSRLIREHAAIFKAIRDHDPDAAVAHLKLHVDGITNGIEMPDSGGKVAAALGR